MNEIEKKEELERLMKKAKDFWATPYEDLIEQGYGVEMIDPTEPVTIDDVTFIDGDVPKVTILNNTERLLRSIDK